jgi:hypothetical protein
MPRDRPSLHGRKEETGKGGPLAVGIVVVLILAVVFSMMSGGPTQISNTENLIAQIEVAVDALTKESFTFEGGLEVESEAGYIGLPLSGEGRIDSENKRMYVKMNLEAPTLTGADLEGSDITIETYTIGGMVYMSFGDVWGKYEAGEKVWGDAHFSQKIIDLMKKFDPVLSDKEMVNNKEAYKVVISPSMEEMAELILSLDPGFTQQIGIDNVAGADEGIKKIEITVWVGVDDFLPVKAEFVMEAESPIINPSGSGVITSNVLLSLTSNFDYKTPFNIVLPSAAQNAEDLYE